MNRQCTSSGSFLIKSFTEVTSRHIYLAGSSSRVVTAGMPKSD